MPEMPPVTMPVATRFNCVVMVKIGGIKFRVVCETGAARSLVRTSFAQQPRNHRNTRVAAYGPRPLSRPVVLEGIIKGRPSATLTQATQLTLELSDSLTGHKGIMEACFAEMADCADPIIVGFPGLARFGYSIDEDDDGHIWVTLRNLGVTLLAETPDREAGLRCILRPKEPRVLEGPCVEAVTVYCPAEVAAKDDWIATDAWAGV